MNEATVTFYPSGRAITVREGTTILAAARQAGVLLESPCNGTGKCGKCGVRLSRQPAGKDLSQGRNQGKEGFIREEGGEDLILACQTEIRGPVSVEVIDRERDGLQILSQGRGFVPELDPWLKKVFSRERNLTMVCAGDRVLGLEVGDTRPRNYGIVVDIGTTTLVAALVDVNTGEELASVSSLNPQARQAQDVLSRIKLASEAQGRAALYSGVITEIKRLIDEVAASAGIGKNSIYEVIFSGNTCMLHLAVNVDPASLGKYPYTLRLTGGNHLRAAAHDLGISEFGLIYLPPVVSAYVGADITSGLVASNLYRQKGVALFIDIGTNGEMVLAEDGALSAASTAAGPAFEGMNITFGMRAGAGAIEAFAVENGSITLKTIGGSEPAGICGSGLLDIVSELKTHGVVKKNGRLADPDTMGLPPALRERLDRREGKPIFRVTEKVFLTQADIRQVQLAKGAVRTGIELLLRNKGLKAADVDRVLIAGSFGYHLRPGSLLNIGLLPGEFAGRIEFMGNTSKSGGQALLLNQACREEIENVAGNVEVVDLAGFRDFDRVFAGCMGF